MNSNIQIFDRRVKRQHRDRASQLLEGQDFLIREVANRIAERFDGEIQQAFPIAVELGCRTGQLGQFLADRAGIETLVQSDMSAKMLSNLSGHKLVADEEWLPFADTSVDLIVDNLNLHWVNDVPGCLIQIQRVLRDRGLFVGTMFGGKTLQELREVIASVDSDRVSPRISPFADVKDAGSLLQRAGFMLPVAETDIITVMYPDAYALMYDLRAMGETNALIKRQKGFISGEFMQSVVDTYAAKHTTSEGTIPATFEIITLTGWKS